MRLLTVNQCAERTGCARSTMYRRVLSGELESVKIGALRRVPEDAYERWVAGLRTHQGGSLAVPGAE